MNDKQLQQLLAYAIEQEQEAHEFYTKLSSTVATAHVRQALLDFARQELGHKKRLEAIREGKPIEKVKRNAPDLQIGDYLVDVEPSAELTYQGALIIAMKKEKAAFRMYRDLAAACEDPDMREVFLFLANEEAQHKLAFEVEYDELIYQEN